LQINIGKYIKLYPQTADTSSHDREFYSRNNLKWELAPSPYHGVGVGGHFPAPNLSGGFHGILKQYWDYFTALYFPDQQINVLLVSENVNVKKQLEVLYPNWIIDIVDLYPELQSKDDGIIVADVCLVDNPLPKNKYHLIISQALLEHVYNPFQVMVNLGQSLVENGVLITHTHAPAAGYHRYPCDYIRFMKDWWYDLEKYIDELELLELYQFENNHVFSCYRKV
jgi:hypothetical protein